LLIRIIDRNPQATCKRKRGVKDLDGISHLVWN
jgi:hypothetical protein